MASTLLWTNAEFGAYQRALNYQADQGHLEEADLRQILGEHWDKVSSKFVPDKKGLFYNKKLQEVIDKRDNFCNSRRQNKLGKVHVKNTCETLVSHMANANANVNANVNANEDNLQKRSERFQSEILKYTPTYQRSMLEAFFQYWSEPNRSKTKMRFEMEKTWDIARRLRTWASRDKGFKPRYGRQEVSKDKIRENAQRTLEILEAKNGRQQDNS